MHGRQQGRRTTGPAIAILFGLMAGLAGCGVRGDLEPPPTTAEQQAEADQREARGEGWWERLLP